MGDDQSLISEEQKTYFEIGLVFIGFMIICGNVFVLVTMYRYNLMVSLSPINFACEKYDMKVPKNIMA